MAKIEITKTELVWPGKYNEDGTRKEVPRVNLPFQVIEAVNESRATREVQKTKGGMLFDIYEGKEGETFEEGWKNKLIWGDNLLVMGSLLEKFAGKIDLIYIDPPFATGADFSVTTGVGDGNIEVTKEQSIIEEKAYRDTWGKGTDSYLQMMYQRLALMRDLLAENGTIYLHCDWRVNSHLRLVFDEIFGKEKFRNEIIWCYTFPGRVSEDFQKRNDTILRYSKGNSAVFNADQIRVPYKADFTAARTPQGVGDYTEAQQKERHEKGKIPESWWADISNVSGWRDELVGYPTQKPEALIDRIIKASSLEGSLVSDMFSGSGTTLAVAEKLGRRWIGCDLGRFAIHTTRKRLLGIEGCRPFEILNLGKYERQYWQGVTFGEAKDKPLTEQALYQYLAFILKLYGAQPLAGLMHIHGRKGNALIHIGAVDAPVTIDEINLALAECVSLKQTELHVLGWEWEMGLNDLMVSEAKKQGIKLLLLQIPREVMEQQAVDKGDIQFFELAYLKVEITTPKKLTATVTLKDFVIPNTELIPEEVRSRVKKWSDYIDYWAIDWDFQNDTFMQGWVTYRTRKDRTLALTSDSHVYEKPGTYRVLVRVVDIFGNDTTQGFDVEVK
jgi:adenine-specific DNA-methyltransferase